MPKNPEKAVRIPEMTHHQVSYLAGALAVNQGAVIEMIVSKAVNDTKEELDNLAQVMLSGYVSHAEILEARAALLEKMKSAGDA